MSFQIKWLLAMMLLCLPGLDAIASETGSRTMDYAWLLFLKVNEPPQVDAGPDQVITHPTNSVYLSAEVIDDPNDKLSYSWTSSGPGTAQIVNPSSMNTTVSFYMLGEYTLQFSANDGEFTSTDTLIIQYLAQQINVMVAVGDSITVGQGDNRSPSGYPPRLEGLLESARGYAHTIWNEGRGGETSSGGKSRISSIIAAHGDAGQYLVMYGTNDAAATPLIPSGRGLEPGDSGYPGSYKDNMQRIIDQIKSVGAEPALAKAPYVEYRQYDDVNFLNSMIRLYSQVVDELRDKNSIRVEPPDFYTWFQDYMFSSDGLHPNQYGYDLMSKIWRDCFLGYSQCNNY